MAFNMTSKQREVLAYFAARSSVSGTHANHAINGPQATAEGFHQTAASLVRRGYLVKSKVRGTVHYEATPAGREYIRAEDSLTRQAAAR